MIVPRGISLISRKFTRTLQKKFSKGNNRVIVAKAKMATTAKEIEKAEERKRKGIQLDLRP
jgi:hypothetical protein